MWWWFSKRRSSKFSASSTAEEVTHGMDGSGLTAVVTGATSGIGAETARVLALRGVHVIMGARSMVAAGDVKTAIVREIPAAKIDAMELDLSSMASVRIFASKFISSGLPLNILMFNHLHSYAQSKLANILHANELARQLKEDGVNITANSLHPGVIVTGIFRHEAFVNGIVDLVGRYVLKNVQQGAATTCYVALHPQVKGISGEYFSDCNLAKASSQAMDVVLAKKLWNFSKKIVS